MPDIRPIYQNEYPVIYSLDLDWLLRSDGTLDDTRSLASAVIVALGTDSLASPDDILPNPDSSDRRGWWADTDAETIWDGWPIGSKLWLLRRTKIVPAQSSEGSTIARVKQYIMEALQPFLDKRIVSEIRVQAWRHEQDVNRVDASVLLFRGPRPEVELRFQALWDELEEQGEAYEEGSSSIPPRPPQNFRIWAPLSLRMTSTARFPVADPIDVSLALNISQTIQLRE